MKPASARALAIGATAGFSIIEAALILSMAVMLSAAIAPSIGGTLDDVRLVRARQDLSTIAVSTTRLVNHVWPERHRQGGFATYNLLVGPGARPGATASIAIPWTEMSARVGVLDDQLVRNTAYSANRPNLPGWRGSYQDSLVADPWGGRYAVNVSALSIPDSDTIAFSAGPNGLAESSFNAVGARVLGDDMMAPVSTSGVPR